jgi:hypothetical protein
MACMVEFVLEDGLGWNWFMVGRVWRMRPSMVCTESRCAMGGIDGKDLFVVDKLKVCKSGMAIARVLWPYAIAPRLAWPPLAPF